MTKAFPFVQLAFKRTDSTDLQDTNNKAIQQFTPSYNAHLIPASKFVTTYNPWAQ